MFVNNMLNLVKLKIIDITNNRLILSGDSTIRIKDNPAPSIAPPIDPTFSLRENVAVS